MTVDLSVVVAVYNEHPRNLLLLLERLEKSIASTKLEYEVIFVNDGSGRPTSDALHQLANELDYVKLVVLSRNFGQQAAISAGLDHAEGQAIVNLDSDCQDPPELIPDMVKLWKDGYDVVYATRAARRDRFMKRLSAFLFYRLLGAVSSVDIPWDTGDFRLMDRKVLEALQAMPEKTRFLRGQIPWLGFRQTGIPIARGAREVGESTYTLRKLFKLALDGLLGFSVAPLYMVAVAGALMLIPSIVAALAWSYFALTGQPLGTELLIFSIVGFFTGIQLIGLGTVGVYISKVLDEVRARPTYVVSERIGLPFARSQSETISSRARVSTYEYADSTRQGG